MEEAVHNHLACHLGHFIVPLHDRRTLDTDFPVAVRRLFVQHDLQTGQGVARRLAVVVLVLVDADQGRAFGDPVAVDEADADALKEIPQLRADGRAPADNLLEVAPKVLVNLFEQSGALVDAEQTGGIGGLDQQFQGGFLALLLGGRQNPPVEHLHKGRHQVNKVGLVELQIFQHLPQVFIDTHGAALMDGRQNPRHRLIGVVVGQHRQPRLVEGGDLQTVVHAAAQVLLGQHNALGGAGSTGGVDNHLGVKHIRLHVRKRPLPRLKLGLSPRLQRVVGQKLPVILLPLQSDKVADLGEVFAVFPHKGLKLGRVEQHCAVTVRQHMHQVRRRQLLVQRDIDPLALQRHQVHAQPFVGVLPQHGNMPRGKSHGGQLGPQCQGLGLELSVAHIHHTLPLTVAVGDGISVFIHGHLQHFFDGAKGLHIIQHQRFVCHSTAS